LTAPARADRPLNVVFHNIELLQNSIDRADAENFARHVLIQEAPQIHPAQAPAKYI
jgi:hypothetical protein